MRYRHVTVVLALELSAAACAPQGAMLPPRGTGVVPRPTPAPRPAPPGATPKAGPPEPEVRGDSARLEAALVRRRAHAPLAYVLRRRSGNPHLAERTAAAVVKEARRLRLSPSLVAAVILVENAAFDTAATSPAGAVGLMQVMPVHGGALGCASPELRQLESNICHGTRVLHMYLRRTPTVQAALRRYNGCVGTLATRRCLRYPARVLRLASSVRREMLGAPASAAPHAVSPPSPPPPPPPSYLRRPDPPADTGASAARGLAAARSGAAVPPNLVELLAW